MTESLLRSHGECYSTGVLRMRKPLSLAIGVTVALLAPLWAELPAAATVAVRLDLAGLVARADRIAVGRVARQEARWAAGHDAIVTEVTIDVARSVKGSLSPGDRVVVLREGGELGDVGMRVEGAARFAPGEEVLVFLERRGDGATWTVGMAQGKLRIETVGGKRYVRGDTRGLTFLPGGPATSSPAPRPLDDLLEEIAALVHRAAGQGD